MSSPNGKDNSGPARVRYWTRHDKPSKPLYSMPGMQKRLHASERDLLQVVADLGTTSDAAVLKMRAEDLQHNRAFVEHQQRLRGALTRLRRGFSFGKIPQRAESVRLKSAFLSMREER